MQKAERAAVKYDSPLCFLNYLYLLIWYIHATDALTTFGVVSGATRRMYLPLNLS